MVKSSIFSVLRKQPFPERMIDFLRESLADAVSESVKSISAAKGIDKGEEWDGNYDWGPGVASGKVDLDTLSRNYLDDKNRSLVELMTMSVRGCSIAANQAKELSERLLDISDEIKNSGYSLVMADSFEEALKCVARLNLWVGRLDFSCRGEKINLHEKVISERNSVKARKRGLSMISYKREIFDNINYCVGLGVKYPKWDDYIHFNQEMFESVNEAFSSPRSKAQVVEVLNLSEAIKGWARNSKEFEERLKLLVRRVEGIDGRNPRK